MASPSLMLVFSCLVLSYPVLSGFVSSCQSPQTVEGKDAENKRFSGLDLVNGCIKDNLEAGVVEPAISKIKRLRYEATSSRQGFKQIDPGLALLYDDTLTTTLVTHWH